MGGGNSRSGKGARKSKAKKASDPRAWSHDGFEWKNLLGKGAIGRVRLARRKTDGKYYAVKCMRKRHIYEKKCIHHVKSEIDVLRRADHPFVVHMFAAFQ